MRKGNAWMRWVLTLLFLLVLFLFFTSSPSKPQSELSEYGFYLFLSFVTVVNLSQAITFNPRYLGPFCLSICMMGTAIAFGFVAYFYTLNLTMYIISLFVSGLITLLTATFMKYLIFNRRNDHE